MIHSINLLFHSIHFIIQDNLTGNDPTELNDKFKYSCEFCDYKVNQKRQLQCHIKSIHDGVKYSCEYCDYKASLKRNLQVHVKSVHEETKYSCDLCDYKSSQKSQFQQHIKSIHDGVQYKCDYCDYKASRKYNLQLHVKSFHDGGIYSCEFCDYKASQKSNLQRHVESIHDGVNLTGKDPTGLEVKTFKCNVCNTTKSTKVALIKHKIMNHKNMNTNKIEPQCNRLDNTEIKLPNELTSTGNSTGNVCKIKDNIPNSPIHIANSFENMDQVREEPPTNLITRTDEDPKTGKTTPEIVIKQNYTPSARPLVKKDRFIKKPTSRSYNLLNKTELQQLLKNTGLKVSGNKDELKERLENNDKEKETQPSITFFINVPPDKSTPLTTTVEESNSITAYSNTENAVKVKYHHETATPVPRLRQLKIAHYSPASGANKPNLTTTTPTKRKKSDVGGDHENDDEDQLRPSQKERKIEVIPVEKEKNKDKPLEKVKAMIKTHVRCNKLNEISSDFKENKEDICELKELKIPNKIHTSPSNSSNEITTAITTSSQIGDIITTNHHSSPQSTKSPQIIMGRDPEVMKSFELNYEDKWKVAVSGEWKPQ